MPHRPQVCMNVGLAFEILFTVVPSDESAGALDGPLLAELGR